jgi:hypothetical protein
VVQISVRLTLKCKHVILADDASIGNDNVAALVGGVLHCCFESADLLVPVGYVAFDELSVPVFVD